MDPPTYPFVETSFMNGPLVVFVARLFVHCTNDEF